MGGGGPLRARGRNPNEGLLVLAGILYNTCTEPFFYWEIINNKNMPFIRVPYMSNAVHTFLRPLKGTVL